MSLAVEIDYRREEHRYLARRGLLNFITYTKPNYQINWHHRQLSQKLNAFIAGKIRFLMVFEPPRHGKSEQVSRRLPAFLHGLYPDAQIMAGSYSGALANDMTADVQKIIDSPEYQELFPGTRIASPGTRNPLATRNSEEYQIIGREGKYRGQGVGGAFTGRGANFCFPAGIKISTGSGQRAIETLKIGDLVWTLNHETHQPELKRVENISSRIVSRMVQVQTTGGDQILCTPDHPFFTEERGYVEAQALSPGERCRRFVPAQKNGLHSPMCFLRKALRKIALRLLEAIQSRPFGFLLLKPVFSLSSQYQESTALQELRSSSSKKASEILQFGMQTSQKPRPNCNEKSISSNFWSYKIISSISRLFSMRYLRGYTETFSSSYRWRKTEQYSGKFDFSLPILSCPTPQIETCFISSVKSTCEEKVISVYDLQVEGNHNFFAENILVHNCILDDPIKGRAEADSVAFRESLWNWYTNDLRTRLEGSTGQILITNTRWHQDDLCGRILEKMRADPNYDQFEVLSMPAIREDLSNPEDPRKLGEALWPEKMPLKELESIRSGDLRAFTSLYQQSPIAASGGLFTDSMFDQVDLPTEFDYRFITADTAYNDKKENDFTVFTAFGVKKQELFVLDSWRQQIKASEIEGPAEIFIRRFITYGFRGTYIEPKGHGIYLNQKFAQKGLLIPSEAQLKEFYSDRKHDKLERANNAVPYLANRVVHFNRLMANKETLIAEALSFPRGKHDDFVDTLIDAVKFVYAKKISLFDVL